MDINTQVTKYFAAAGDSVSNPGDTLPAKYTGNTVLPLIDGRNYFQELRNLLDRIGTGDTTNQFFYMTGWCFHLMYGPAHPSAPSGTGASVESGADADDSFRLEGTDGVTPPPLAEVLAAKSAAGVDVRMLAWVDPFMLGDIGSLIGLNDIVTYNLLSIDHLRNLTVGDSKPLARSACALNIGHPRGAMHLKMVVASDGTHTYAFTGGIDFLPSRIADELHTGGRWHDMAIRIEGPAVQACYNLFRDLWNEQISRPLEFYMLENQKLVLSVVPSTKAIPGKSLAAPTTGKHRVQVARTLPQFNFQFYDRKPPLSFAPDGAFEVKMALRKAIMNAENYIYMEDQGFWSREIMGWLNDKLKTNASVKVLLLTGAPDPNDPPNSWQETALRDHLIKGLQPAHLARLGVFLHGAIVHSKVTIVDDHWLFIGSANCMRRSLYTDGELSVGVLDEDDLLAKKTRADLWGGHFGLTVGAPRLPLLDLNAALAVWESTWGTVAPPCPLPAYIKKHTLVFPPASSDALYDLSDYDSREPLTL
ncbi:phospholipase D family protein [Paenibacillus mendelii]|uniref:Phospholipase D family protein n=1 Tax=Paenibacillus mendelii TaxID=206163 RepID=A0ABV6JEP1_9BACL|nr:phospholipase D family protein [Paenibacillus mendelii]